MSSLLGLFTKRNAFDLTHTRNLTCDMGQLVPILCEEILPGDTWRLSTDLLVRISPMLAPVMHMITAFTHFFFVPYRLLWDNWENFITGGQDGNDQSTSPYFSAVVTPRSLFDHLGLPVNVDLSGTPTSAFFARAYALIFNEWFRDEDLQTPVGFSKDDGQDNITNTDLLYRNWEKDYFTSARPWPQRGPAVQLPLGGTAPVGGILGIPPVGLETVNNNPPGGINDVRSAVYMGDSDPAQGTLVSNADYNGSIPVRYDSVRTKNFSINVSPGAGSNLSADLSEATAATVNDLRLAFQIQKWMERNARAGVRYVESILAHFGIRSSDARLQRPEFLGGGRSPVVISEVLQTSSTDQTSPQANMAGHGYSAHRSHTFRKSFEEHGVLIGLLSIMPRTCYQQGIPRKFSRKTRFDYYWPEFAHLGEQAVLRKEIYANQDSAGNETVFGYQGRYDEYRRRESSVHGDFKTSLNFWHLGRIFADPPNLNADFVKALVSKRINAVPSENNCWVQVLHQCKAIRPIPLRGEPGLIDHN